MPEPLSRLGHGMDTFLEHCATAGLTSVVDFIRCNQHMVHGVHKSCKLDLFNKASKLAKQSSVSDKHTAGCKCTRTSTVSFDFKELCFYCSKPTSECERDEWHCVEMLEMRETIMQAPLTRLDDLWALEIKGRLEYATDLIALEARYHFECHRNFTAGRQHTPHKVQRGRPVLEVAKKSLMTYVRSCLHMVKMNFSHYVNCMTK